MVDIDGPSLKGGTLIVGEDLHVAHENHQAEFFPGDQSASRPGWRSFVARVTGKWWKGMSWLAAGW